MGVTERTARGDPVDHRAGPAPSGDQELVVLEIPASAAYVGIARTVTTAVAGSVEGLSDGRLEDLRLAVSEACTNAIEAQAAGGPEPRVVLRCSLRGRELEVRIEDSGGGFDPDQLATSLEPPATIDLVTERGWGIHLIRALVDDVEFASTGPGTAVRMVIRLD
ncbi:MAG: ATP-binding protein [Acidimicrobiia bacterium]|nr:ATP-binding protein [Acidimicrobiia bacterium]